MDFKDFDVVIVICDCFQLMNCRVADIFGAQAALSLSCVASIVSFLLLAIADTPAMLFMQKLPSFFMHGLPGKCKFPSLH